MTSSFVLSIVTFVYFGAMCLYWAGWVFHKPVLSRSATLVAMAGVAGNLAGFGLRWWESHQMGMGHIPLTNMYESLVFFAMVTMAVSLVLERQYRIRALGAVVAPFAFLAMAYASLKDAGQVPLVPALQSNWLTAHVFTAFLGYAGFAAATGLAVMYLLKKSGPDSGIGRSLPEAPVLDQLMYQNILLGFLFLTVGIITGAVWANSAWGRYWSWDPKETWSLITWLIYAALIHLRLVRGWIGKRTAIFAIVGFAAVLFTWFGVNYLSGLHSYAS
ncbi:MAG: c-type cytochrome biogenesis protein CcsB [Pseudomonadota bacterium]